MNKLNSLRGYNRSADDGGCEKHGCTADCGYMIDCNFVTVRNCTSVRDYKNDRVRAMKTFFFVLEIDLQLWS